MALVPPSQLVVDRFLPTFRAMLARRLADRGLTQEEIAANLGVTQASISAYVSGDRTGDERFSSDPDTVATADRIADGLATDDLSGYEALDELVSLIRRLEDRGPICALHEEAMPELEGLGCDLCVRGFDADLNAERTVLQTVRKAARALAAVPGASAYVPNVGTNVGMALPDATDATGVAAIPGRIYVVGDRIEVPANPEFGASQHVATAVLAATAVDPDVRGAINVATDDRLLKAARARGFDPLEFDPEYEDRRSHFRERFTDRGAVPRVVYHRGAFGIEPITYLFGETPLEAVETFETLLEVVGSEAAESNSVTDGE